MKTLIKIILLSASMSALIIAIDTGVKLKALNKKLDDLENIVEINYEIFNIQDRLNNLYWETHLDIHNMALDKYLEFDDLKLPKHNYPKENYNEEIRKGN